MDPQTLCEKLSVMASLYNTGARELATDRSPELPDPPLSMPQKNKVENNYGKYLTATLTVHTTPKDTHPKYFNQEVSYKSVELLYQGK